MTNYEQMKNLLQQFTDKYGEKITIESNLYQVSVNKSNLENVTHLYERGRKQLQVIDMDEIAHKPYCVSKYLKPVKQSDSAASVDAFLISSDDKWYFIEFKDQTISRAKEKVIEKAYANWYWLLDILYEMRGETDYPSFCYENPIMFAKQKIVYILVVSEEKNYENVRKMHECVLAGEKFKPEYMEKLEKYIYNEAYVYTPELLEREFVKKFKY